MSFILRDICNPYNMNQWSSAFSENAHMWLVGNGRLILFWEDKWFEGVSLAEKFPRLYRISRWKHCNIQLLVSLWKKGNIKKWSRELRAWEEDSLKKISDIVNNISLSDKRDIVIWKQANDSFSTKECYKFLEGLDNVWERNWKGIWKLKMPPKIQIFLWKFENEVLPTHSFLKDRLHVDIDTACKICRLTQETISHIFIECGNTINFWMEVASWWSLNRKQLDKLLVGYWQVRKFFAGERLSQIWNLTLSAAMWTISSSGLMLGLSFCLSPVSLVLSMFKSCLV